MKCHRQAIVLLLLIGHAVLAEDAAPAPPNPDELTLKEAKVGTDEAALLQFFRERTLNDERRNKIQNLIGHLGDESYESREKATKELIAEGPPAVSLVRQAITSRDADIEMVRRGEKVLDTVKAPGTNVAIAAARLLAQKKANETAGALLAYLPFADDDSIIDEARSALASIAVRDGQQDKSLVGALEDKLPLRRAAAAEALVRAGTPEQRQTLLKFLQDPDPTVRLRVALGLVEKKDKQGVPVLVALLADLPQEKAWQAEEVLCRLAADQTPNVPLGTDEASRKKCRDAWSEWWTKHGGSIDLAKLDEAPRLLGYTLIVQIDPNNGIGKVVELGTDGKPRWQINGIQYPVDAQVVRNDRVLIAEYNAQRVTERDFNGKVVWEKRIPSPINVQRLTNGNTFIACHNQLLVVDPSGKETFTYSRPNHDVMSAIRLRDGQFFFVTNGGLGIRIDSSGKEVKSFATGYVHQFSGLDVLPNGKLLIPQVSTGKVTEFDLDGKTGWSAPYQQATSATRLPNGNTLVASFNSQKVIEMDSTGKTVSTISPDGRPWKARKR